MKETGFRASMRWSNLVYEWEKSISTSSCIRLSSLNCSYLIDENKINVFGFSLAHVFMKNANRFVEPWLVQVFTLCNGLLTRWIKNTVDVLENELIEASMKANDLKYTSLLAKDWLPAIKTDINIFK